MTQSIDEDLSLEFESTAEQTEQQRLLWSKDRGLISEEYYNKYMYETGRLMQPPTAPPKAPPRMAELRFRRQQRADASEEELEVLLGIKPFRGCAQAKRLIPEGQTPKAKRIKITACTPEPGMKEARIKAGFSACSKHLNGHKISFCN